MDADTLHSMVAGVDTTIPVGSINQESRSDYKTSHSVATVTKGRCFLCKLGSVLPKVISTAPWRNAITEESRCYHLYDLWLL